MMPEKKKPGPKDVSDRRRSLGSFLPKGQVEPDELDRQILRVLPDEGAKLGKYLPGGMNAATVRRLVDPTFSSGSYARRLAKLLDGDYVLLVSRTSRGGLWQRTTKGKLAAATHE